MSATLVETLADEFEPERFTDEYQEQLRELIEAKLKKGDSLDTDATFGEDDAADGEDHRSDKGGDVIDLMDALRRSVEKNKRPAVPKKTTAAKKNA